MNKPLPLIILVLLTIVCVFLASTFMPEDKQNSKPKKIEDFRLNLNSSGTKLKQFEKQFKAHIKTKSIPTELNKKLDLLSTTENKKTALAYKL